VPCKVSAHTYSVHTTIEVMLIMKTRAKIQSTPCLVKCCRNLSEIHPLLISVQESTASSSNGKPQIYWAWQHVTLHTMQNSMVPETWEILALLHVACLTACLTVDSTCSNARQTKCKQKGDASDLKIMTLYMHTCWTLSPNKDPEHLHTDGTWFAGPKSQSRHRSVRQP